MTRIPGLPIISDTLLPAGVRGGSESDKQKYKTAMGFEQMLVGRLVQTMTGTGGGADGTAPDAANPLASGPFSAQMQDALSGAVMSAGGLGLAGQIYKGMRSS